MDTDPSNQPAALAQTHRTDLVTLVFTDIVGSTSLKHQLGDQAGVSLIQGHHAIVRETLARFPEGKEVETAGDSFLIAFTTPSAAVAFALLLQARVRGFSAESATPLKDRIGIHLGEVVVQEHAKGLKPRDLYGIQVDICARVMSLAEGDQTLLTRSVFDSARQMLKGGDIQGVGQLSWLNHGPYAIKGLEEPIEICEVGEVGPGPLKAPATTEKARRHAVEGTEPVLGWRPAVDQVVPGTQWVLKKKLGEGGFGEVWLGRHQKLKEERVFKFCFRADRVRSLKREMTLFRLLKERVGDHPNIVRLLEVYFEEPPFYVVMDHVDGQDLNSWCKERGGVDKVPMEAHLEIVIQIANALQAAHDAGVIHRDVKPGNILVRSQNPESAQYERGTALRMPSRIQNQAFQGQKGEIHAKLSDFGIGQVVSEEALKGITRSGFTQTIIAESSSSQTGSQMYMAPELFAGKPASIRSDIYSLGVVLYQLAAGDLTLPVTTDWAENIGDPLLKEDLQHCFAGNPEQRFAGAGQLADRLRSLSARRKALAEQQAALKAIEKAAYRRGVIRAAAVAVLVVGAIALLAIYSFREAQRADRNAASAIKSAEQANAANAISRREAYAADMNLIPQTLMLNNLGRARRLLDRHRPRPGEEDLRGWEWRYLWQLVRGSSLVTLTNGPSSGFSVSFSPDGGRLAAGWDDGSVDLWDVPGRRMVRRLTGGNSTGNQGHAAFSPVSNLLAAPSEAKTVSLYNLDSGRESVLWHAPDSGEADLLDVAFSPDGSRVVISAADTDDAGPSAWVVNVSSGRIEKRCPIHPGMIGFAAGARLSPDNQRLYLPHSESVIASRTNVNILCLDVGTGREVWHSEDLQDGFLTTLAVSPDGRFLASGAAWNDPDIRIWDAATGQLRVRLAGHTSWICKLVFTKDGGRLISSAADQTIRFWDTGTWAETGVLRGHADEVWGLAESESAHLIASAGKDGKLMLWNDEGTNVNGGHLRLPKNIQFAQCGLLDRSRVIFLSNSNAPEIFDLGRGESLGSLYSLGPSSNIWTFANGLLGRWDGTNQLQFQNWDGSQAFRPAGIPINLATRPVDIAFSPARQLVAWSDPAASNSIFLAPLATLGGRTELKSEISGQVPGYFGLDGKYLITYSRQSTAHWVWDVDLRRTVLTLDEPLTDIAFAGGGRELVVLTEGNEIRFYDLDHPGQAPRRIPGQHTSTHLGVSPDGKLAAACDTDGIVRLCDAVTGTLIEELHGHLNGVGGIAFSPDGRRLISASGNLEAVKVWDVATRQELLTLSSKGGTGYGLTWSTDGDSILSGIPWQTWHAPSWAEIEAAERSDAAVRTP